MDPAVTLLIVDDEADLLRMLRTYLERIVHFYETRQPPEPVSYRRRHAEIDFALNTATE